ncbi:MAG: hypothetical protein FWH35_02900 [Treponema sp.]|nr:hypothetical protein [Treponema sp.]
MKNWKKYFLVCLVILLIIFIACKPGANDDNNDDGLTKEIHNIIPDDILEAFKELGIEINGGKNPPNIEGTFLVSPLLLIESNFSDSLSPGYRFDDNQITFSKQDNANLTVVLDYINGPQIGSGLGSFITGSGNKFSVFTEISGTLYGSPYKSVEICSGEITSSGIANYYWAFMITEEAPSTVKRGQGRLGNDGDGFSERLSSGSTSWVYIPDHNLTSSEDVLRSIYSK